MALFTQQCLQESHIQVVSSSKQDLITRISSKQESERNQTNPENNGHWSFFIDFKKILKKSSTTSPLC
jgi:hypothetical protein